MKVWVKQESESFVPAIYLDEPAAEQGYFAEQQEVVGAEGKVLVNRAAAARNLERIETAEYPGEDLYHYCRWDDCAWNGEGHHSGTCPLREEA